MSNDFFQGEVQKEDFFLNFTKSKLFNYLVQLPGSMPSDPAN